MGKIQNIWRHIKLNNPFFILRNSRIIKKINNTVLKNIYNFILNISNHHIYYYIHICKSYIIK